MAVRAARAKRGVKEGGMKQLKQRSRMSSRYLINFVWSFASTHLTPTRTGARLVLNLHTW
jgi:hypothetical protein